jgi:hypothetical protein
MRRLMIAVFATIALVSGCASSGSDAVSPKAAQALAGYVQALRTAASGTDVATLRAAVLALDHEVDSLKASSEITAQRAQDIENAAAALQSEYVNLHSTPPTTPTPSTSSPPPSSSPPTTPTPTITITVTPTVTPSTSPPVGPPSSKGATPP